MNIAYIGSKDALSYQFIHRLSQEEDEVYFVSNDDFTDKKSSEFKYKFFKITGNAEILEKVLTSIHPDVIVFSGFDYMDEFWLTSRERYLSLLHNVLEYCGNKDIHKFIFLSSVEIYEKTSSIITEDALISPSTSKGILCAEGEYMVSLYKNKDHLPATILRASQVYSNACSWDAHDFLSNAFRNILNGDEGFTNTDGILYPLHVADLVEGIKRATESPTKDIFNISGSFPIKKSEILRFVSSSLGKEEEFSATNEEVNVSYSTAKIQKKLEWIDFKNIRELLKEKKIVYTLPQKQQQEKKRELSTPVRKTIENIIIFAVFFFIYYVCMSHNLFSKIDWLLIYVTLTSLFFGIGQSALSVILASGGFLLSQNLSIFEMNNFYSYAESVLVIVQFIFFGISISYTSDQLKEKLAESKRREQLIHEEYQELKSINQQNVYIKNEYEKRLLESKMSMPQLYEIVKRIMVLSPDRIFMEVIQVVSKVIKTKTVAIYLKNAQSPYLRLINSLNEKSVVEGKSWNVSNSPAILKAIESNEIYQGNTWENEPALIVPIANSSAGLAILVIKELPYEQQTLYQMNLLTTLLALVRDALTKAFEYETQTRSNRYIGDCAILVAEEFKNAVRLAEEKREKGLADFCILEFLQQQDYKDVYEKVENLFRITDNFGLGNHGKLYILLNNTSAEDAHHILQRMENRGVRACVCTEFCS